MAEKHKFAPSYVYASPTSLRFEKSVLEELDRLAAKKGHSRVQILSELILREKSDQKMQALIDTNKRAFEHVAGRLQKIEDILAGMDPKARK